MVECPLYLMTKPPPAAIGKLGLCRAAHCLDHSYSLDRFHCTVLRLGNESDRSPAEWQAIARRLGGFASAPFDVVFDTLDGRVLRGACGSTAASQFHRAIARHLAAAGFRIGPQGFWLHLTLAYRGPAHPRTAIEPIAWRVEQFALVRSVHAGIDGPGRHETLDMWPFTNLQLALAL